MAEHKVKGPSHSYEKPLVDGWTHCVKGSQTLSTMYYTLQVHSDTE